MGSAEIDRGIVHHIRRSKMICKGLCTFDPPLGPPSKPVKIIWPGGQTTVEKNSDQFYRHFNIKNWIKTPCKFLNPVTTHFVRKVTQAEREKEKNSGHIVPCSAGKPLWPIIFNLNIHKKISITSLPYSSSNLIWAWHISAPVFFILFKTLYLVYTHSA